MVSWQGLLASTDRLLSSWEEGQEEALVPKKTPADFYRLGPRDNLRQTSTPGQPLSF